MKKIGLLLVMLVLLVSCSSKMSPKDVLKEFNRVNPGIDASAIRYKELENPKKFDDVVYQILAKEGNFGLDFNIYYIMSYYGGFGQTYRINSDYHTKITEHLYDQYGGNKEGFTLEDPTIKNLGQAVLNIKYSSLDQLKDAYNNTKEFVSYALESDSNLILRIRSYLNPKDYFYPDGDPKPKSEIDIKKENTSAMLKKGEDEAIHEYVKYSMVNQINLDEIKGLEYLVNQGPKKDSYLFKVIYKGEEYSWDDLILNGTFGMSHRTLFEVLKRLGYDTLKGEQDKFSFEGKDGLTYKFDKEFKSDDRDIMKYPKKSYYYLKDDKKTFFNSYDGRSLSGKSLNEILDLEIKLKKAE